MLLLRHLARPPGVDLSGAGRHCFAPGLDTCPRIWRPSSCGHSWKRGDESVAAKGEALFELATLDGAGHALYVVQAVKRQPNAAHAHQSTSAEHPSVARHVQTTA